MEQDVSVTITCALCGAEHTYPVTITRVHYMGLRKQKTAPPTPRSFVKLFTCPARSETFQATLTFSESAQNRIEAVSVGEPESAHD